MYTWIYLGIDQEERNVLRNLIAREGGQEDTSKAFKKMSGYASLSVPVTNNTRESMFAAAQYQAYGWSLIINE